MEDDPKNYLFKFHPKDRNVPEYFAASETGVMVFYGPLLYAEVRSMAKDNLAWRTTFDTDAPQGILEKVLELHNVLPSIEIVKSDDVIVKLFDSYYAKPKS